MAAMTLEQLGIRRIHVIINLSAGRVGPDAPAVAEAIFERHGLNPVMATTGEGDLSQLLDRAVSQSPDLLVIIAGDGTARAAAEAAAPNRVLLAPLPGGTMNMLPSALYGGLDWPAALEAILAGGQVRSISGGSVDGHAFYVAAILGSPALWARAREAARSGRIRVALERARQALSRAFTGRLRFTLDGARRQKAEALTLMCPLVSRDLEDDAPGLEAAALDPAGALDVFRLAFAAAAGAWRQDPAVAVSVCRQAYVWAGGAIPAILDGEPVQLGRTALVRFNPAAFRALVPEIRDLP